MLGVRVSLDVPPLKSDETLSRADSAYRECRSTGMFYRRAVFTPSGARKEKWRRRCSSLMRRQATM